MKRVIESLGHVQYTAIMRKPQYWRIQFAIGVICEMDGCTTGGPYGELVFDHCHRHGWVRGMLCNAHNVKVGRLEAVMRIDGIVIDVTGTSYGAFLANCPDCRLSPGDRI